MPVVVRKIGEKWRVVNRKTSSVDRTKKGNAADGGGHGSRTAALRQATAINLAHARKKGYKVPKRRPS